MKSKFFAKEVIPTDTFIDEITILKEISSENKNEYVKWFNSRKVEPKRLQDTIIEHPEEAQNLSQKFGIAATSFFDLYSVLTFVFDTAFKLKDDIHSIIDDLISLDAFPEDQRTELYEFFDGIKEKGFEIAKQRRRNAYEKGEIADLTAIDYDVDLRLIPEKLFDPEETHIEDYNPSLAEVIPIALISLTIENSTKKESFAFQLNFSQLEDVIVKLQACQKEFRLLEALSKQINSEASKAVPSKS
jgi:hypothetical protein